MKLSPTTTSRELLGPEEKQINFYLKNNKFNYIFSFFLPLFFFLFVIFGFQPIFLFIKFSFGFIVLYRIQFLSCTTHLNCVELESTVVLYFIRKIKENSLYLRGIAEVIQKRKFVAALSAYVYHCSHTHILQSLFLKHLHSESKNILKEYSFSTFCLLTFSMGKELVWTLRKSFFHRFFAKLSRVSPKFDLWYGSQPMSLGWFVRRNEGDESFSWDRVKSLNWIKELGKCDDKRLSVQGEHLAVKELIEG